MRWRREGTKREAVSPESCAPWFPPGSRPKRRQLWRLTSQSSSFRVSFYFVNEYRVKSTFGRTALSFDARADSWDNGRSQDPRGPLSPRLLLGSLRRGDLPLPTGPGTAHLPPPLQVVFPGLSYK